MQWNPDSSDTGAGSTSSSGPRRRLQESNTPPPSSSERQSLNDTEVEPANKRRRTALACSSCRSRKQRCDGRRPSCSACYELNLECVYRPPVSSSNTLISREYISALETRLRLLERRVDSMAEGSADLPSAHSTAQPPGPPGGTLSQDGQQGPAELQDSTDGMGSVVFNKELSYGYFGPSSNIAFMGYISRAIPQDSFLSHVWPVPEYENLEHNAGHNSQRSQDCNAPTTATESFDQTNALDIYALPSEARTRELINQYFSEPGLLFPFIHKPSFVRTYDEMIRKGRSEISRTWLGLLNMMLALAATTTVQPDIEAGERIKQSDIYKCRAIGLCQKRITSGTCSLEVVQYLLVFGQYLQGCHKSNQTWAIHGLAVKAAFQLGLHSKEALQNIPPLEGEIRRRTWFMCIVLDRTLSMSFGRPASIPESYSRIELPREFPSNQGVVANDISLEESDESSVPFFVATITLYKVLWEIISTCYDDNIGSEEPTADFNNASRIFTMEQKLTEWKRNLPDDLTLRTSKELLANGYEATMQEKFRVILTLRYLNIRILLHRSFLVKFLQLLSPLVPQPEEQELLLLKQIGSSSMQICEHASKEIITIIGSVVVTTGPRKNLLGAWWFSLYYVFNAALVLFGLELIYKNAIWSDSQTGNLPLSLPDSFNSAIEALTYLDKGNKLVSACRQHLEQLSYIMNARSPITLPSQETPFNLMPSYPRDFIGNMQFGTSIHQLDENQSPLGMDLGEFTSNGIFMDGSLLTNLNNHNTIANGPWVG